MTEEQKLASQYRQHAAALRAAAAFDDQAKTSVVLSEIARDYDLMATALEGVHETNTSTARPNRQSRKPLRT